MSESDQRTVVLYPCTECGRVHGWALPTTPPVATQCHACWVRAARFRAGMTAMARFMTWVWMEASVQWDHYHQEPLLRRHAVDERAVRLHFLADALESGRLALRWPDGE